MDAGCRSRAPPNRDRHTSSSLVLLLVLPSWPAEEGNPSTSRSTSTSRADPEALPRAENQKLAQAPPERSRILQGCSYRNVMISETGYRPVCFHGV